ncbi:MAG: hypothetical protein HZB39_12620 [Planctomycetes bacterium]|nr:hypothetical protein [Planctomycetota bacterium]
MMRHFLLVVFFAAGALHAPAAAQQIQVGFDRRGVHIGASVQFGPRCIPQPRWDTPCEHACWEVRRVQVWVDGCERIEHVPARWGWRRDSCGRMVRMQISPAYDRVVREPGRWGWREERVAVPCSRRDRHRH